MKKTLSFMSILALLLAGCLTLACTELTDERDVVVRNEDGSITYILSVDRDAGTKALTEDGNNLKKTFAVKDQLAVVYTVGSTTKVATSAELTSSDIKRDGKYAEFSVTLEDRPNTNSTVKYIYPASLAKADGTVNYAALATQNGTLASLANNLDLGYKEITLSGTTFPTGVKLENPLTIVKFTLMQKVDNSNIIIPAATSLIVNDGSTDYTITPTAATHMLYVALPATGTINLSTTVGGIDYSYHKTGAGLTASKFYDITVKMTRDLVNLANITGDITLLNGDVVIGTLGSNRKISIADGAIVTLSGVNINGSGTWSSGNYAGLNCLGNATINLADGTTNSVKGFNQNYPGIQAAKRAGEGEEYTLLIQGTGTLNASSNGYAAGIGGGFNISCGNIIINGGEITANGGTRAAGIGAGGVNSSGSPTCGDITINGGTVAAYGGSNAAGIGNGAYYTGGSPSCGDITINGGEVTATGGSGNQGGAGIGNGHSNGSCGDITISGGTVTATGGNGSAGIGGGYYQGNCGAIIISGGTVTATGGGNQEGAAGIGGGYNSACGDITISGGTVTANGGYKGVGIGGGYNKSCGDILISGGTVEATGGDYRAGIGAGYYSTNGTITIQNTVTRVTATKGADAVHSIGISSSGRGSCGTVTIGGVTGAISTSPYTYEPGVPLASSSVGYRVCSDGLAYATNKTLPSGVTVIGVVARKSGTSGIVLYKQDNPGKYTWENRNSGNPSAVNVYVSNLSSTTSKSWTCGERDQYVYCGVDGTNWSNLQTRLTNAGCEELSTTYGNLVYWTNTCPNDNDGWAFTFDSWTNYNKTNSFKVRPLFEF